RNGVTTMANGVLSDYEKYAEDVEPAKVLIRRRIGNFIFVFYRDGYKGVNTGEYYISRDTALSIEKVLRGQSRKAGVGLVLSFSTPQVVLPEAHSSTAEWMDKSLVFEGASAL